MSGKSFVHAHVHTDYSALDGAAKIQSLVEKVVELGQPGVAVTDHGNSQGTHELWKAAKEHDINAILGQEFYVAPSGYSRTHRSPVFYGESGGEDKRERSNDVSGNGAYTHMTIWAENNDGKFNLFKLSTLAYLEGKYMKPRIDIESLSEYSKGLIGTTGCPSGEIQTRLRLGQWDEAIKYASQMQDILGKDNYYCEIMDHGLEIERVVKPDLLRLSKELKIPLIATNDTHYVNSDQVESHDHLLCISGGSTIDAEKRFKFSGNSYYIKSAEEMRELFKDHPEACDNTLELNERCNVSFDENADLMPKYDVPEGTTDKEFLSQEVIRLIPDRVAKWDTMDEEKQNAYFKQAEYECGIINLMGFASYFLVVADFVQWAKDNKIAVGPGRGCLTEETNVLTPQGYVEIKTIKPGDEVYDTDGTIVVVPETFAYPVEDENLITLNTENGTKKSLTVDHKVLVKRESSYGNNTEWIKAKELAVGDKMVIPKRNLSKNPARTQSAKDLGSLVALLHARTTHQGTRVEFDDVDSVNRAKTLFKSAYNRELKSEEYTVIDDAALAYLASHSFEDTLNGLLHQDKNHHQALGFVTELASLGYVGSLDNHQYKIFEQVSKGVGAYFSDGVDLCLEDNGSDVYYNEIISIQSDSYEGEVYDFTVPTTHSYITDSGIVHNSAGGCLVAYALSITDIDPIKHGLIFERFLNPDRVSMPDIDIDFDDKRRGEVIEYVTNKYGQDKVSQIITYTMIKAKSALKDATRILDFPYALGDTLSKKLPPDVAGKGMKLYEIYDVDHERYGEAEEFRDFVEKGTALFSPQMCKRVLEVALGIEGYLRTTGIHAAGVIMSSHPIAGIIPMMDPSTADKESSKEDKKKKKKTEEAPVLTTVTQYDYPTCESLGLLKMDFLGLRNLTIITDALKYVKENHGVEMTLDDIIHSELDDKKTYELLQRGEASSIFQLESAGMRSLLKSMAPTGFNDIVAVLALYRPGPMGMDSHIAYADRKNDREPVTPIHPELEEPLKEILGETFGLIIYQEQIMQIAQKVAGYSLAQADLLRRAMGKKKKSELDKQEENFVNGMKERGYSKEAFQALWDTLLPFADYAFNKSHSAGYALLSYTTAYLKAHYPEEYMAAVLTSVSGTPDKTAIYLNECKKMGIEVNPPSISLSDKNYSAKMKKILFGLNSVRGLGEQTVDDILKYRTQTNYCSVPSMLENLPVGALNKKVFEGLIFGGALDEFGYTRRGLNENLVPMLSNVKKRRNEQEDGEVSLFEAYEVELPEIHIPDVREYSKKEKLSRERHILGLYLSDHPLSSMGATLESQADRTILDIRSNPPRESSDFGAGEKTVIAGVITSAIEKTTRKGEKMLTATVEDVTGEIDIIAFPKTYKAMGEIVQDDIYKIAGTIRNEEDRGISMIVDSYETLEIDEETGKVPMWLKMYDKEATEDSVDELKEILQRNPGETPVRVSMKRSDGSVVNIRLGSEYTVKSSPVFSQKLMALFGSKIFGKW